MAPEMICKGNSDQILAHKILNIFTILTHKNGSQLIKTKFSRKINDIFCKEKSILINYM
jgi:hypothetical protein